MRKISLLATSIPLRLLILLRLMFKISKFFVRPSGTFIKLFKEMLSERNTAKSSPLLSLFMTCDVKLL